MRARAVREERPEASIRRLERCVSCRWRRNSHWSWRFGQNLPLAVNVYVNSGVDAVLVLMAADSGEAVVLTNADVLADVLCSSTTTSVAVFFGDAYVLAVGTVVSTGRAGLRVVSLSSIFPSSALDGYTLVSLDLSCFGTLLVPVGRRKDAERDSAEAVSTVQVLCLLLLLTGSSTRQGRDRADSRNSGVVIQRDELVARLERLPNLRDGRQTSRAGTGCKSEEF